MDSSPDEALVHLLAGLENDGYHRGRNRMPSPCRSFGNSKNPQNSDEEENELALEDIMADEEENVETSVSNAILSQKLNLKLKQNLTML